MLTMNHAKLSAEVGRHVAADAVIQGAYWTKAANDVGGRGCFIGCLAHGNDPQVLADTYGLPVPLVKICETVFEGLPADDARAFFAALPGAVGRDGKDLSRVHWAFLGQILRELPDVPENVQAVIDRVIGGMDLLASGESWPGADAARAARAAEVARAADVGRAVYDATLSALATEDAARAAAAVARAAQAAQAAARARAAAAAARVVARAAPYDANAAYCRQRDILLDLIRAA